MTPPSTLHRSADEAWHPTRGGKVGRASRPSVRRGLLSRGLRRHEVGGCPEPLQRGPDRPLHEMMLSSCSMSKRGGNRSTILDHIKGIKVPGEPFAAPTNEYWALAYLRQGLCYLASQAAKLDAAMRERVNPRGDGRIELYGTVLGTHGIQLDLLTCSFHWYSISACMYVRTVGTIARRNDGRRKTVKKYLQEVIPEIADFRDKVGAHFVWTMTDPRDNSAERQASIIPQLAFRTDSFYVGALRIRQVSGGAASDSAIIRPWSIVKEHLKLCRRYWPDELRQAGEGEQAERQAAGRSESKATHSPR
jgi:hypothetical protein